MQRRRPATFAVVVKGADGMEIDASTVQQKLDTDVGRQVEVRVKSVRPLQAGVRLEMCSKEEVDKLKASPAFKSAGLCVEDVRPMGVRMIVTGVKSSITTDDLMSDIYNRNVREIMSHEAYVASVKCINRVQTDGTLDNVVLEVPERLRDAWGQQGRLFIGWSSCRVHVLENALGCHKCYALGHRLSECGMKNFVCKKCGKEGHMKRACVNAEECRNCKLKGLPCNHSVTSLANCPVYRAAYERLRGYRMN